METLIATLREALELLEDYAETDIDRGSAYDRRLSTTRNSLVIIVDSLEEVTTSFEPITPPAV